MTDSATLPNDYQFVAGDHGSHVFSVTFRTRGTQSLTVKDKNNSSISGTEDDILVN